jgi:hypothetical protein
MFDSEMNSCSPKRLTDSNKLKRSKRKHYMAFNNNNNTNEENEKTFTKKSKMNNNTNIFNTFENSYPKNNLKSNEFINIKTITMENNSNYQCNLIA